MKFYINKRKKAILIKNIFYKRVYIKLTKVKKNGKIYYMMVKYKRKGKIIMDEKEKIDFEEYDIEFTEDEFDDLSTEDLKEVKKRIQEIKDQLDK